MSSFNPGTTPIIGVGARVRAQHEVQAEDGGPIAAGSLGTVLATVNDRDTPTYKVMFDDGARIAYLPPATLHMAT